MIALSALMIIGLNVQKEKVKFQLFVKNSNLFNFIKKKY